MTRLRDRTEGGLSAQIRNTGICSGTARGGAVDTSDALRWKTQPSYTVAGDENGAAAVRDVMAVFQNLKIGMAT